jgi:hypothetical protein
VGVSGNSSVQFHSSLFLCLYSRSSSPVIFCLCFSASDCCTHNIFINAFISACAYFIFRLLIVSFSVGSWTFLSVFLHYFPPFVFSLVHPILHVAELQQAAFPAFECDARAFLVEPLLPRVITPPTHACQFLWHLAHHEFPPFSIMLAAAGISAVPHSGSDSSWSHLHKHTHFHHSLASSSPRYVCCIHWCNSVSLYLLFVVPLVFYLSFSATQSQTHLLNTVQNCKYQPYHGQCERYHITNE